MGVKSTCSQQSILGTIFAKSLFTSQVLEMSSAEKGALCSSNTVTMTLFKYKSFVKTRSHTSTSQQYFICGLTILFCDDQIWMFSFSKLFLIG